MKVGTVARPSEYSSDSTGQQGYAVQDVYLSKEVTVA